MLVDCLAWGLESGYPGGAIAYGPGQMRLSQARGAAVKWSIRPRGDHQILQPPDSHIRIEKRIKASRQRISINWRDFFNLIIYGANTIFDWVILRDLVTD